MGTARAQAEFDQDRLKPLPDLDLRNVQESPLDLTGEEAASTETGTHRIAILTRSESLGGVQKKALLIASGLSRRAHEVDLLLLSPERDYPDEIPERCRLFFVSSEGASDDARTLNGPGHVSMCPVAPEIDPWRVRCWRAARMAVLYWRVAVPRQNQVASVGRGNRHIPGSRAAGCDSGDAHPCGGRVRDSDTSRPSSSADGCHYTQDRTIEELATTDSCLLLPRGCRRWNISASHGPSRPDYWNAGRANSHHLQSNRVGGTRARCRAAKQPSLARRRRVSSDSGRRPAQKGEGLLHFARGVRHPSETPPGPTDRTGEGPAALHASIPGEGSPDRRTRRFPGICGKSVLFHGEDRLVCPFVQGRRTADRHCRSDGMRMPRGQYRLPLWTGRNS